MPADAVAARERLRHVYWIGGGSGAGKSTAARRLAERHGLALCSTDDLMADHARRLAPGESPHLRRFAAMDLDERWVTRSPAAMLDTFHWFRGEGFGLIVEDLLAHAEEPGVVVEGFRLLPRLVEPLLAEPRHAVWLLPTPRFRRAAFESRGSLWEIANRTGDPPRALANLLERDRMFTDRLREEAGALDLHVVELDTGVGEDGLVDRVERLFGL
ncbi:AAA family ATPase [Saccharothrix xinjiangensis]|uniref:AAA family ATPase n=1 Tax=Saccharothrix xinjiangensis TaxID=204798 RepID=A0ABV9YF34_9PSEU